MGVIAGTEEDPVAGKRGHPNEVRNDGDHENRDQQEQNSGQPFLASDEVHAARLDRFAQEFRLVFGAPNDHEIDDDENEDQNQNGAKQRELQVVDLRH